MENLQNSSTVVELTNNREQSLIEEFKPLFDKHKAYFATGKTKSLAWRKQQLNALQKMISKHEKDIISALHQDLGKCKQEAYLTEIGYTLSDIKHTVSKLKKWMKPRRVGSPLAAFPAKSYIQPEPLGTVLIIGAWNYPFQLTIAPFIAALAAGNCAILKPSELAANTSQLIAKLIPDYLDSQAFSVVEGAKDETSALLTMPFNKIFYTGGEQVGKIVMSAAARHLTPVTLELGGKSPCVVDSSADIDISVNRIVWGKFMNAGQTCIAPDYVLVEESIKDEFIEKLKTAIETQYSTSTKTNADYGRIINQRHCQRLAGYLVDQDVIYGGDIDIQNKFISPTLVVDPDLDSQLMQEEIFGPILPILSMPSRDAMLDLIQSRPHPLAAYLYTKDDAMERAFVEKIAAGNMCINDSSMFMLNHNLPFGGVGTSGMGNYHGKFGFDTFSHHKTVMSRSFKFENSLRYAPFTAIKSWLLNRFV